MKQILAFLLIIVLSASLAFSQTNIRLSNPEADSVLKGLYNPLNYLPPQIIDNPQTIIQGLNNEISTDSLKSYLIKLSEFGTRNSGSDTSSSTIGIGAARRWALAKFQEFSNQNHGRLLASYLDFDLSICGVDKHKNILAVLPGTDTVFDKIILIEAHLDSRCDVLCDTACIAEGVEDNASGSALVLELARIMSKYTFEATMLFMLTTAEEQGLLGADAMADYASANNLPIKAVLNNDIVGGIICGQTSSAPSCPGLNHIDSTQVRLFSGGGLNSKHKALSRHIKITYEDELLPIVSVPMQITIMSQEDRSGRGGDHIPFRQQGFTAMRFTSANEHGNASAGPGYTDRQHTSNDILGVDTNNDNIIDSFFIDFNYLARNAIINAAEATALSSSPRKVSILSSLATDNYLKVEINDPDSTGLYKVGIRTTGNDFDTIHLSNSSIDSFPSYGPGFYFLSACAVDQNGIEGLFSNEEFLTVAATGLDKLKGPYSGITLLQNKPNPFDEATLIAFHAEVVPKYSEAFIQLRELDGREITRIPVEVHQGMNEVIYNHGYNKSGTFIYTLVIDNVKVDSKRMVFAF
ncbi:M28 family peptidase [Hyphobacterium sp. CCMP332]|nr:M28 family peptidase [Hyphobacterium sp. CCMP332]